MQLVRIAIAMGALIGFLIGTRALAGDALPSLGDEATLGLGCILFAAFAGGELAAAVKLPRLTGYLVLGFLVGPSLGGLLADRPPFLTAAGVDALGLLDNVAIGIIAFKGGGELQWAAIRTQLRSYLGVLGGHALGGALCVGATVFLAGPALGLADAQGVPLSGGPLAASALLLGTIAMAISPATTLAIRSECRARGPVADTALGVCILADVGVAVVFAVTAGIAGHLVGAGAGGGLGAVVVEVIGSLGAGIGVGLALAWALGRIRNEQPAVLLACAIGTMVVAERLHLSGLLVCMVAGFVVENFSSKGDELIAGLEHRTLPIFAVFFAIAGARIDLDVLAAVGPLLLAIPVARAVGIRLGTGVAARLVTAPDVVRRRIWTGLLGQAGMTLALAAAIAEAFGELGRSLRTIVLGVIAVNQVVGPILFRWALVASGEEGGADRAAAAESTGLAPAGTHP